MSTARTTAGALVLALGLALSGPAAGADQNGADFRGRFSGPISGVNCTQEFAFEGMEAGGTWRVNLHATKATARFLITVDGVPHVAWTAQMERVTPDQPGTVFQAELPGLGADGTGILTITLDGNGAFAYTIAPYDFSAYGWGACESVTYSGHLS